MKKSLLLLISCSLFYSEMHSGIFGTRAESQLTKQQIQRTASQLSASGQTVAASSTTSTASNCPACPSSTSTPLPNFVINMYDASGTSINTYQIQTDSNFTITNALLIVHIFPPSNSISSNSVALVSSDSSYAVMYTLKALDGTLLQKSLQYLSPATGNTAAIPPVMVTKSGTSIPTSISIAAITPATAATAATTTVISGSSNPTFLPNMSPHSTATQQRIFNGITPMSQKFLITVDGSGSITATQISGMFDTDNSTDTPMLASSLLTSSGKAIAVTPTQGKKIQPVSVTISDGTSPQTITFAQSNLPFDQQDLQNGLALNVHIFPPSSGLSAGSGSNYILISTLRTLDGLKLRKQIQQVSFSNTPYQFSIAHGSSTILSSTFINSNIGSQAVNLISPINLRCLLQKNSDGNVIVSML